MAATGTPTPNIGLRIPQGTDSASVADINYNSTVIDQKVGPVGNTSLQEQINSAEEAMAYVVNGNDAPSGGIPSGKYVYVKNNTNGIATGMYITTAAISSGATVQASSLSACSEGAVNSLNSNIGSLANHIASLETPISRQFTGIGISDYGDYIFIPMDTNCLNKYKNVSVSNIQYVLIPNVQDITSNITGIGIKANGLYLACNFPGFSSYYGRAFAIEFKVI